MGKLLLTKNIYEAKNRQKSTVNEFQQKTKIQSQATIFSLNKIKM